jgi:hypothetical protein
MAHYFIGRVSVGKPFEVEISARKKVRCTIFKRWVEKESYECTCGVNTPFKVTKTWGISKTAPRFLKVPLGAR